MLKSCRYCGKIHDSKFDCGKKPVRKKAYTKADYFRRTQAWTNKAIQIKRRDNYLCQICIRGLYGPRKLNHSDLSVHHAVPVIEDWEKRLDGDNLITTCLTHHEMMENGTIPYEAVRNIIDEQEAKAVQ